VLGKCEQIAGSPFLLECFRPLRGTSAQTLPPKPAPKADAATVAEAARIALQVNRLRDLIA
jgi:hypothetical protein